jgi:chromosome segregation ATPase
MRLKEIELREVGTFADTVRIDGIKPGLNVLAGPNELGKSTLLRGLTALFLEAHRTTKKEIKELRPYQGGAPYVASRFELGGHDWRLEKQFLSAHKALLQRTDGKELHQGADAENRLAELLSQAGSLHTSLPLLWVEQGKSFEVPQLSDGVRQSLGQLLAAQAESTAGIGPGQAVLQSVEAELATLVTLRTGKARKGGMYEKLRSVYADVQAALDAARQRASDAEARLSRLGELQAEEAELSDVEALASLKAAMAQNEAQLQEADEARRHLKQLTERSAFLEQQKAQREAALASYDEGLAERDALSKAMRAASDELTALQAKTQELDGQLKSATATVAADEARKEVLTGKLEEMRKAADAAARRKRWTALDATKTRLEVLEADIAQVDAVLSTLDWPASAIGDLRRAVAMRDQLAVRQSAGAPRVRIAYVAGRTDGFSIDGASLRDGDDVVANAATTIVVDGIGEIEVIPGASDTKETVARDLELAENDVARLLGVIGAQSSGDVEAREAQRTEASQKRQVLLAELQALAPDGRSAIVAELAQLEELAGGDSEPGDGAGAVENASADDVEAELKTVAARLADGIAQQSALVTAKAALDEQRAGIAAELRMRRTRCEELDARYLRAEGTSDPRDELVQNVAMSEQTLNAATRERLALTEVAMTDEAVAQQAHSLERMRADVAKRGDRLGLVRQEMRLTEGMLARDFEDGADEQVRELEARSVELQERIADKERHIAALQLLSSELGEETARRRDEIAGPLAARLSELAGHVWPEANVALTSSLTVGGLSRDGRLETNEAVSAGTREQMAVLSRLAYAGLIGEGAEQVPLILDDPLVFSDDRRLGAVFEAMVQAAKSHQIIILTCHETAFEPLISHHDATRLTLAA